MNGGVLGLALLFGVAGFYEARRDARRFGRNPYGMDPVIWGVICFFSLLIGAILLAAARSDAKKRQARAAAGPFGFPGSLAVPATPAITTPATTPATPIFAATGVAETPAFTGVAGQLPAQPQPGAQWAPDPSGRHDYRWWNGQAWTSHVSTNGAAAIDPV
jgi:hypothetical protein